MLCCPHQGSSDRFWLLFHLKGCLLLSACGSRWFFCVCWNARCLQCLHFFCSTSHSSLCFFSRAADKMGQTHFVEFASFALGFARKVRQKSLGSVAPLCLIGSSQLLHGGSRSNRLKLKLRLGRSLCASCESADRSCFSHIHPATFQFLSFYFLLLLRPPYFSL